MALIEQTSGRKFISDIYYHKSFGDKYPNRTTEYQERLKLEFKGELVEGIESGKVTVEDLVDFITDIKFTHERVAASVPKPGPWD